MRHLDEGLIHAWLDGAAGAGESREIETHIATCDACAAMVAEARGLVAGASRILTGLDHVPGGVIPRGAPAAAIPRAVGKAGARAGTRRWSRSPALRAAAVVIFLGGGTVAVLRQTADPGRVTESIEMRGFDEPTADVTSPGPEAAPSPAEDGAPAASGRTPTGESRQATARDAVGKEAPGAEASPAEQEARRSVAGEGASDDRANILSENVRTAEVSAARTQASLRAESSVVADRARAAQAGAAMPPVIDSTVAGYAARRRRVRDTTGIPTIAAPSAVTALRPPVLGGTRDSAHPRLAPLVVAEGAGTAGVEFAGCYTITLAPWVPAGERGPRSPALPAVLELQATMLDVAREGPRMTLRVPGDTADVQRADAYWQIVGRDSLVLVWGAGQSEAIIRLGGSRAVRTGVAEHDGRRASVTAERLGDQCAVREGIR